MSFDSRWLDILKASGWQLAAIASACGIFLLLGRWLPPFEPWMIQFAVFGLLLCGCLAIASLIASAAKVFPAHLLLRNWLAVRKAQRSIDNYIPFMTDQERAIIAYLLAKNQKVFTSEPDGGYAATLLSRGIVCISAQPGQTLDMTNVPMAIPDHAWAVLMRHKDEFPYEPRSPGETESHPWRIPWMAR